jgi:hypothetical protein
MPGDLGGLAPGTLPRPESLVPNPMSIDTSRVTWQKIQRDECPACGGPLEQRSNAVPDRETSGSLAVVGCSSCGKQFEVCIGRDGHSVKELST